MSPPLRSFLYPRIYGLLGRLYPGPRSPARLRVRVWSPTAPHQPTAITVSPRGHVLEAGPACYSGWWRAALAAHPTTPYSLLWWRFAAAHPHLVGSASLTF